MQRPENTSENKKRGYKMIEKNDDIFIYTDADKSKWHKFIENKDKEFRTKKKAYLLKPDVLATMRYLPPVPVQLTQQQYEAENNYHIHSRNKNEKAYNKTNKLKYRKILAQD